MISAFVKAVGSVSIVAAALLSAGCPHAKPETRPSTVETQTQPTPTHRRPLVRSVAQQNATTEEQQGQEALGKALAALGEVDLFFGFNDETLTEPARNKLGGVAEVLSKYPTLRIRIDGNCDERGTEEYNMALGQKRADSAKKYLVELGAKPEQVSTLSYGQEKPRAEGHDEKSWQENRRDDVVPVTPAPAQ